MRLTFLTIALVLLFLVIPVLLLVLREHLRQRHYGEKLKKFYADREAWRARLLNPKLEEVEAHLHGKLPARLAHLYSDKELILDTDFEIRSPKERLQIGEFFPLDCDILSELWGGEIFRHGFPFAGELWGDCYFVQTSPAPLDDAPVFRYRHKVGKVEQIAESISQFLSWKHQPRFSAKKLKRKAGFPRIRSS